MQVLIRKTGDEVAETAARAVVSLLGDGAHKVLGVATGSSPLDTYRALEAMIAAGELDLSDASAFALDEYVGLPATHDQSYADTIRRTVTEPFGMKPENVHVPEGAADDLDQAGARYDEMIREAGGVDCQILGIGANGHIGFNEPGTSLASRTHVVSLTRRTREDNARFFSSLDEVPTHALTQGLGTILDARSCVLIALGENKADAIAAAVEGPLSASCPASVLQLHPHAVVVVDEAAASKLERVDYYRDVDEHRLDR